MLALAGARNIALHSLPNFDILSETLLPEGRYYRVMTASKDGKYLASITKNLANQERLAVNIISKRKEISEEIYFVDNLEEKLGVTNSKIEELYLPANFSANPIILIAIFDPLDTNELTNVQSLYIWNFRTQNHVKLGVFNMIINLIFSEFERYFAFRTFNSILKYDFTGRLVAEVNTSDPRLEGYLYPGFHAVYIIFNCNGIKFLADGSLITASYYTGTFPNEEFEVTYETLIIWSGDFSNFRILKQYRILKECDWDVFSIDGSEITLQVDDDEFDIVNINTWEVMGYDLERYSDYVDISDYSSIKVTQELIIFIFEDDRSVLYYRYGNQVRELPFIIGMEGRSGLIENPLIPILTDKAIAILPSIIALQEVSKNNPQGLMPTVIPTVIANMLTDTGIPLDNPLIDKLALYLFNYTYDMKHSISAKRLRYYINKELNR